MTTKELRREKRYRLIVEAIQRWGVKLEKADRTVKRAVRMIAKLERARQRAEKQMKAETQVESPRVTQSHPESPRVTPLPPAILLAEARATADLDDIPGFLYRGPSDGAVAAEIKAQIDDKKREKARVRIEHMKAKRSGETRKMPLTGRAALDALK